MIADTLFIECDRFLFFVRFGKFSYEFNYILLDRKCILCSNSVASFVNVSTINTCFCDVVCVRAVRAVLVGICEILENENRVGKVNLVVNICISVNDVGISRLCRTFT